MSDLKKSSLFPGLLLIVVGAILLLNKLLPDFLDWRNIYPIILIAFGILMILSASCKHKTDKGAVFPGTILFLIGLFFFLRNFGFVEYYYVREIWPIFIIILGLGFLALFIAKPTDRGSLVPAGLFIFFGVFSLLNKLEVIDLKLWEIISNYWPVILIIIGGGIILGSLKRGRQLEN